MREAPAPVGVNIKRGLGVLERRPGRNGCMVSQDSSQYPLYWDKIKGICFNLPRTVSFPWTLLVTPQVENVQVKSIRRKKKILCPSLVMNIYGACS